ncbi:hypothetical protein, partial [Paraglaciecola chathamensis]|uniref:hypothetical protein n=1 Tax=Paraglaciecola chathamensis TaxID=368405 RepID=UPI00235676D0
SGKFESPIDSLRSLKHALCLLMTCGHYCMRFAYYGLLPLQHTPRLPASVLVRIACAIWPLL